MIRLIANNDLQLQRIGGSGRCRAAFRCFVRDNTTVWHDGYMCTIVRSVWGHPPQTCYTRESELKKRNGDRRDAQRKKDAKRKNLKKERARCLPREWKKTLVIRLLFRAFRIKSYARYYYFLTTPDIPIDRQYDRKLSLSSSLRSSFVTSLLYEHRRTTVFATFRNY